MPKKPASTRATDTVTLTLGLVTIPLAIYSGTDSTAGVTRKEFLEVEEGGEKVDHPVGRGAVDKVTGELIEDPSKVVRKIMTEYGAVYVSDEEIEQLMSIEPKTMTVTAFQPLSLFVSGDNYIPSKLYYVEPAKTKIGSKKIVPAGTLKAFMMLLKAMREEGVFALVEYTSRGLPKPAALMPNGTLWQLHHTDECREQRPLDDVEIDSQTVGMGRALIGMYRKDEPLDISDKRSALINAFAEEKAAAGDFSKPVDSFVEAEPAAAPDNLMAMLQASLEAAGGAAAEAKAG